ncbi:MAG TPA: HIT domain-containing protein [Egibacteraceae bacterium]|jgi:ATP adenylyltransferase|nr:HIT domain-containing protein [Egibacteraceae bacterium]
MSPDPPEGARRVDEQRLDALQRLWTPWRMAYIRDPDRKVTGCPFCVLPGGGDDREALIVHRADACFVILNAYPYNPGHLMVVPYRHVDAFDALTRDEVCEMALLSQRAVRILAACTEAQAFNLGVNVGAVAGAGIADHIHQHVVPRWGGDTNFMPVIAGTRVLPEMLEDTYDRLAPAFAAA